MFTVAGSFFNCAASLEMFVDEHPDALTKVSNIRLFKYLSFILFDLLAFCMVCFVEEGVDCVTHIYH